MDKEPILLAGDNSIQFAYNMSCGHGNSLLVGEVHHHRFPSGEWYCQIKQNVRGRDVFLVQTLSAPVNENLMQLCIMADAARRASAASITAIIPYFGYARQDRKDKPRVPISAKLVMDILQAAGVNRVVTMDLHAPQIAGFTNLPFDQLKFLPCLVDALKPYDIDVVVSPDEGAIKKCVEAAKKIKSGIAFISKIRLSDTEVGVNAFIGDVKDKNVLVLDDLTESAGTIVQAAQECRDRGAKNVYAAVTHGCITNVGSERLTAALKAQVINAFFCSNTIPVVAGGTGGLVNVVDVSTLFGRAVGCIHTNSSISSLFE